MGSISLKRKHPHRKNVRVGACRASGVAKYARGSPADATGPDCDERNSTPSDKSRGRRGTDMSDVPCAAGDAQRQ